MKLLVALVVLVAVVAARPDESTYSSKFDNIDIKELTGNPKFMKAYNHCFIDTGKCTAEANDIKKLIREGIETSCKKCSDKHKELIKEFLRALKKQLPEEYDALIEFYDPTGKYREELEKFMN